MSTLYELVNELKEFEGLEGEFDSQAFADTMEGMHGSIHEKVINVTKYIKNVEAEVDILTLEIDRLKNRKTALANKKERLRTYLRDEMVRADIPKVSDPLFTISTSAGRWSSRIVDVDLLPDEYVITSVEEKPDTKAINEALAAEKVVPGAEYIQGERSLRIR